VSLSLFTKPSFPPYAKLTSRPIEDSRRQALSSKPFNFFSELLLFVALSFCCIIFARFPFCGCALISGTSSIVVFNNLCCCEYLPPDSSSIATASGFFWHVHDDLAERRQAYLHCFPPIRLCPLMRRLFLSSLLTGLIDKLCCIGRFLVKPSF